MKIAGVAGAAVGLGGGLGGLLAACGGDAETTTTAGATTTAAGAGDPPGLQHAVDWGHGPAATAIMRHATSS